MVCEMYTASLYLFVDPCGVVQSIYYKLEDLPPTYGRTAEVFLESAFWTPGVTSESKTRKIVLFRENEDGRVPK